MLAQPISHVAGCALVFAVQGLPEGGIHWLGYIVGREDAVKERSDQQMLHFLARTLAQ